MLAIQADSPCALPGSTARDTSIQNILQLVLAETRQETDVTDRRRAKRYPYPYPIRLTPISDGVSCEARSFVVIGRHLASRGLDFYHKEAISERQVIASLNIPTGLQAELLLELNWCRFGNDGWYTSGGKWRRSIRTLPVHDDRM